MRNAMDAAKIMRFADKAILSISDRFGELLPSPDDTMRLGNLNFTAQ